MRSLFFFLSGIVYFSLVFPILIITASEVIALEPFVASSGSMIPSIQPNDIFYVDDEFSFNNLNISDIIVFRAPDPMEENKTIVARISAIIEKENNLTGDVLLCAPIAINEVIQEKTILTKGDANECSIPGIDFPITQENYIGKVFSINNGSKSAELESDTMKDSKLTSMINEPWLVYPYNNIKIQYPSSWVPDYSLSNKVSFHGSNIEEGKILIWTEVIPQIGSSAKEIADHANTVYQNISGFTIIESFKPTLIGGREAATGVLSSDEGNTLNKLSVIKDSNVFYLIQYINSKDNFFDNTSIQIMNKVIATVSFD